MGSTFSGNFSHSIDPKGRVTIPMAFRDLLGGGFTLGLSKLFISLALYPKAVWEKTEADFLSVQPEDDEGMRYVHLLNDFAFKELELDGQGRILLPPSLRQLVGLDKNIRFIGAVDHLEIWDEQRHIEYTLESLNRSSNILKHYKETYAGKQPSKKSKRSGRRILKDKEME